MFQIIFPLTFEVSCSVTQGFFGKIRVLTFASITAALTKTRLAFFTKHTDKKKKYFLLKVNYTFFYYRKVGHCFTQWSQNIRSSKVTLIFVIVIKIPQKLALLHLLTITHDRGTMALLQNTIKYSSIHKVSKMCQPKQDGPYQNKNKIN